MIYILKRKNYYRLFKNGKRSFKERHIKDLLNTNYYSNVGDLGTMIKVGYKIIGKIETNEISKEHLMEIYPEEFL